VHLAVLEPEKAPWLPVKRVFRTHMPFAMRLPSRLEGVSHFRASTGPDAGMGSSAVNANQVAQRNPRATILVPIERTKKVNSLRSGIDHGAPDFWIAES